MAGKSEGTGASYKGKHFSRNDKMRQNDNHITGETWKVVPNTDFAYYSNLGRFCTSHNIDFPHNGAYLCTDCLLYTSPSPRDRQKSRMPSSA